MTVSLAGSSGVRTSDQSVAERFLAAPSNETFRDLFRVFCPRLLRYFQARGCDAGLAEELTQDVLLTVYRRHGSLRDPLLFRPWLIKIARNALLAWARAGRRRPPTVELNRLPEDAVAVHPEVLAAHRFNQWMSCLDEAERQAMLLRFVDELEYHEIAEVLGIPTGTVQWRVFRAKRKIADRFGGGG